MTSTGLPGSRSSFSASSSLAPRASIVESARTISTPARESWSNNEFVVKSTFWTSGTSSAGINARSMATGTPPSSRTRSS